ncbi:stage V sporulation protein S [Aneurinibacillus sp. BA2021]|nr:stage V sporulation protein S [Aneurinibacillus sp. BA2021]
MPDYELQARNHKINQNEAEESGMQVLKVSGSTNPKNIADALAIKLCADGECELQAVGPQAVNQMVKAAAIGRNKLGRVGFGLSCIPGFFKTDNGYSGMNMIIKRERLDITSEGE